jgi:hypothetical protein
VLKFSSRKASSAFHHAMSLLKNHLRLSHDMNPKAVHLEVAYATSFAQNPVESSASIG